MPHVVPKWLPVKCTGMPYLPLPNKASTEASNSNTEPSNNIKNSSNLKDSKNTETTYNAGSVLDADQLAEETLRFSINCLCLVSK
ncbi:unnamed protein product [Gordionus sp. m RMFG-2023]